MGPGRTVKQARATERQPTEKLRIRAKGGDGGGGGGGGGVRMAIVCPPWQRASLYQAGGRQGERRGRIKKEERG